MPRRLRELSQTAKSQLRFLGSLVVKRKYADSGLDKEQFAKVIGVSLPQLYLMLRGDSNPSLLIVIEIARRLGVGMWELLGVEPVGEQ